MEKVPPICSNCETPMRLIPSGISKKTGKSYDAFYSCPNNRECGSKPISIGGKKPQGEGLLMMDELRETNKRLDSMADYLIKRFEEIEKAIMDIKR